MGSLLSKGKNGMLEPCCRGGMQESNGAGETGEAGGTGRVSNTHFGCTLVWEIMLGQTPNPDCFV